MQSSSRRVWIIDQYAYALRTDSQRGCIVAGRACFEAGQRIQFQSRSDLNWLTVLTESMYKLELHAATVIGTTLRWHDSKLELDCIEDSCVEE